MEATDKGHFQCDQAGNLLCYIICHLQQIKIAQRQNIGRNRIINCQVLDKPFKNCPRIFKIGHCVEFSPNLVTLVTLLHLGYYHVMTFGEKTLSRWMRIVAAAALLCLAPTC